MLSYLMTELTISNFADDEDDNDMTNVTIR
jgi:hypothetical protein